MKCKYKDLNLFEDGWDSYTIYFVPETKQDKEFDNCFTTHPQDIPRIDYRTQDLDSQCGMLILSEIEVFEEDDILASVKDLPLYFDLFSAAIYGHTVEGWLTPKSVLNGVARYILTDAGRSNYHTRYFAEYFQLPGGNPIINPNSGHYINNWWFDILDENPEKNKYLT